MNPSWIKFSKQYFPSSNIWQKQLMELKRGHAILNLFKKKPCRTNSNFKISILCANDCKFWVRNYVRQLPAGVINKPC